jgi:hypothetical protein
MDALRKLFGGGPPAPEERDAPAAANDPASPIAQPSADEIEAEERARELELLRAEQERLDDLIVRQQRYADRSWVPPSQGGPRRSDDGETSADEDRGPENDGP